MKRTPLKSRLRPKTMIERVAEELFRERVLSEPCLFSQTRPDHVCDGPLDPHHVIPKQTLKHRPEIAHLPEAEKWGSIHDPANGVALCRAAHDPVTTKADRIYWSELPQRVIDNAYNRRLGWLLETECPEGAFESDEREDLF